MRRSRARRTSCSWASRTPTCVADLYGKLDQQKREASAAPFCQHCWFTYCASTVAALERPVMSKMADKRRGIEVAALRQSLWRAPGEEFGDPAVVDARPSPEVATDYVRWVDTDIMIADPLTKVMDPEKLIVAMQSNFWDLRQPEEGFAKKRARQAQHRRRMKTGSRLTSELVSSLVEALPPVKQEGCEVSSTQC